MCEGSRCTPKLITLILMEIYYSQAGSGDFFVHVNPDMDIWTSQTIIPWKVTLNLKICVSCLYNLICLRRLRDKKQL